MHRQWGWHQRAAVAQPLLCAQLQLGSIRRRPCVVALLLLCAQLQLWQTAAQGAAPPACTPAIVSRIQWGAGTNSLGIEGAAKGGGRAPSVWDGYGGASADEAIDFYNRYPSDIKLMQQLGLKHLRLSLSWSRLLPGGVKGSPVNPEAVRFYSSVLDSLAAAGIQPMLVLYHWDLPKALQDGYGGLLGASFASDFSYFADTAFRLFGPRVKRWLTFIEPAVICNQQYGNGQFAPGVAGGDAARYRCGHNLLLAHGEAVRLYRAKYAASQGGQLSFSTLVTWPQPVSSSSAADKRAAQNKLDAEVGWFLDPVFTGDYPASLKQARAPHLPAFTPAQQQLVRDSLDFIAANAFTSKWVWARPGSAEGWQESRSGPDGRLIGPATGVSWMNDVPSSQGNMLRYLAQRYRGTPLVISSSGTQVPGEEAQRLPGVLDDAFRVSYYRKYLDSVCEAVAAGDVNLLAWYAWSLFDGYEWTDGYSRKFGIVHIAFDDGLKRTPKVSARWLSQHFFKRSA